MSIKHLNIFLLCIFFVLADSSSAKYFAEKNDEKILDEKIRSCVHKVEGEIKDVKKEASKPFVATLNEVKGKNMSAVMISMPRWMQLKNEFIEINWQTKEALEDILRTLEYCLEGLKIKQAEDPKLLDKEFQELTEKGIGDAKIVKARWSSNFFKWANNVRAAMKFSKKH